MIQIFRVDDRLLHGQVAKSWTRKYHIDKIMIVNTKVANDEFSKVTLYLAKPQNVELYFYETDSCYQALQMEEASENNTMLIVENFNDAYHVWEMIPYIREINIGGQRKKKETGALQIGSHVILQQSDLEICKKIMHRGVKMEIRQIPGEQEISLNRLVKI